MRNNKKRRIVIAVAAIIVSVAVMICALNTEVLKARFYSIDSILNECEEALERRYEIKKFTTNRELSDYAHKAMSKISVKGSVVVVENETGAVCTLLTYDDISGTVTGEWVGFVTPGSLFTAVSAIPIFERGVAETELNDTGIIKLKDNVVVHNFKDTPYGIEDIKSAIANRSKVWFAYCYDEKLNTEDARNIINRALIGKRIRLDFMTLKSSCEMTSYSQAINAVLGNNISVEPIQIAAWYCGICSGTGKVIKPHIGCSDPKLLTELTDSKTASKIRDCLIETGNLYHCENTCVAETHQDTDGTTLIMCGNTKYTVLCGFSKGCSVDECIDVTNSILINTGGYCDGSNQS